MLLFDLPTVGKPLSLTLTSRQPVKELVFKIYSLYDQLCVAMGIESALI